MTALDNATARLQKFVRTNDRARLADALQMSFGQIDAFGDGKDAKAIWGGKYADALDAIAEYVYYRHRRYDAATDTLVSVNTAEPLPLQQTIPQEEIQRAIASSFRPLTEVRPLVRVEK